MDWQMLLAAALGIGPALALMFWTLKDYTYPKVERPFFDDRKLFLLLAVGMVVGVVIYSVQSYFSLEFVLYALLFAVLEELIKLVILNFPRFQRKLDTAFYGYSFGLGIGSTMAFGAVFLTLTVLDELGAAGWLLVVIIGIQFVLLHASAGALVGTGSARGEIWGYFSQAGLMHIGYNLLMVPFFMGEWWGYITFVLATLLVAYYYMQVHRHVLPAVIDDAMARMKGAKD
ncbi:MAG: hypothetical protein MIO90_05955 [Methanomassiliicoccales archaeon]|nr:hypothetical protein [Methanomassiliicoccales archaeon]